MDDVFSSFSVVFVGINSDSGCVIVMLFIVWCMSQEQV
jgi:hypothetical protein